LHTGREKELVVNAACNRGSDGISFTFFIEDAESLNLNLPRKLALGIHQLLAGIATQTQWFIGLSQISATDAAKPSKIVGKFTLPLLIINFSGNAGVEPG